MATKIGLLEFNPQDAPSAKHAAWLAEKVGRVAWALNRSPVDLEVLASVLEGNLGPGWFVYQGGHHVAVHAAAGAENPRLAMFGEAEQ